MRTAPLILFMLLGQGLLGQGITGQMSHTRLLGNKHFTWVVDSTHKEFFIYYQPGSWTASRIATVRERVWTHFDSVKSFVGLRSYDERVHLFIVGSRSEMKTLIGRETNGAAFHRTNTLTGIASADIRSIFSNHELFHVVAGNVWGEPERWINEGMAVHCDKEWHGHDLHQLTKYLIDTDRYVPLDRLIKRFNRMDSKVSYPLIGSFVTYLDKTYGRETVVKIWKGRTRHLETYTGKTIEELEADWLSMVRQVEYTGITY